MPNGKTTNPSGMAWKGRAIMNKTFEKEIPFFKAKAPITPQRIWVAARAPTTGPKVTKNPIVEPRPTKPAISGPKTIESITGTCEAKVAEYPTVGIVNWNIPLKPKGMAKDKAMNNAPKTIWTLLKFINFFVNVPPLFEA